MDDRHVEDGVAADNRGRDLGAISQRDSQLLRTSDNVRVRHDVPELIDDESGTGAGGNQRIAVRGLLDLLLVVLVGIRRVRELIAALDTFAPWKFADARELWHAGKSFDPRESTELDLTEGL